MTTIAPTTPAPPARPKLVLPAKPRPWSRVAASLIVTLIVIVAFWSVEVNWARLGSLPGEIVRYLWLMFSDPNWDKFGEALLQTWRSVQMAWVGTVIGLVIALPLSFLSARGFAPCSRPTTRSSRRRTGWKRSRCRAQWRPPP